MDTKEAVDVASSQLQPIMETLLEDFEVNLRRHQISIFGKQLLRVNAFLLATKSDRFHSLYADAYEKVGSVDTLVLRPEDVCCVDGLEILLYFCHFGCVRDMRIDLLRKVLTAAQHFRCTELEQYALDFTRRQLCLETGNKIWQQVGALPESPVTEVARTFVLRRFLSLARREDFLDFSADALEDLLTDERLNAWREDLLVEPLLRWLRAHRPLLWDQIRLLSGLRLELVTPSCQRELRQVDGFKYFSSGFRQSPMFASMRQPAEPRRAQEGVLLVGGLLGNVDSELAYFLDPRTGRWAELRPGLHLPERRAHFACAVTGDSRVVVAGGSKGRGEITNTCLSLDLAADAAEWKPLANLNEPRWGSSAVLCGSVLYVIGGEEDRGYCSDAVEALETSPGSALSRWRRCAPLPEGRAEPGVASVGGRVIACGGFLSPLRLEPCELADQFDPATDQWTRLAPMRFPRGCPGLLALDGCHQLLVQGGNSDADAERLDCAGGHPRWVSAAPVRGVGYGSCSSCRVDSRWLLVEHGFGARASKSTMVPLEQLKFGADVASPDVSADVPGSAQPNWFRGLSIGDFGICRVSGLAAIDRLLEGATWL